MFSLALTLFVARQSPHLPIRTALFSTFSTNNKKNTVASVLKESLVALNERGVPEAEESVIHLCAKALDLPWDSGYRDLRQILNYPTHSEQQLLADQVITDGQQTELQDLLMRRIEHLEPIQYLVGQWDFLDYTFAIKPPLLCPRPETEQLVEIVCQELEVASDQKGESTAIDGSTKKKKILDIGSGTGCIGISIIAGVQDCQVEAIDIDPVAIQTSRENADRILEPLGRMDHYQVQLTSIVDFKLAAGDSQLFDVVVSNPPYIPANDMGSLDETVRAFESEKALCGGADGLDIVREIVARLPTICRSGATCWLEVDPSHPKLIAQLVEHNDNVQYVESVKDLFGLQRFVKLKIC